MSEPVEPEGLTCARCGRSVEASKDQYEVFERMHYTCFHYEFEHPGDPDVECFGGGCPAAGLGFPSLRFRIEGVELAQAGNTVVPAILALRALGFAVSQVGSDFVAVLGNSRFQAEDPVSALGLVKLAEIRRPWRASDVEIDQVIAEFRTGDDGTTG